MLPNNSDMFLPYSTNVKTGGPGGGPPNNKNPLFIFIFIVLIVLSALISYNITINT